MTKLKSLSVAAALATAVSAAAVSAQAPSPPQLMAVLTTADPQTQFMALTLLRTSGVEPGQMRILLCGPSGDLALKTPAEASPQTFGPQSSTAQALLMELGAQGAKVEVCAIYLPGRQSDRSLLLETIGVASPTDIGPLLVDPAVRVLTF